MIYIFENGPCLISSILNSKERKLKYQGDEIQMQHMLPVLVTATPVGVLRFPGL